MFMRQKLNETGDSFESRHTCLSARITVQTAVRRELTKADAFTRSVNTKQRCEIQCETLQFSDEHAYLCDLKPNRRNTVCNETVRRLFNLPIYHGFTVTLVTLTAPWYCGRKVGYSHWIVLQE